MPKMYVVVNNTPTHKDSMASATEHYVNLLQYGYAPETMCIVIGRPVHLTEKGVVDPDDIRNQWYFNQEEEGD